MTLNEGLKSKVNWKLGFQCSFFMVLRPSWQSVKLCMWFLFLFILQNLLHICCRFPAGNIKVKPIMRLHSTAHNCHHFVTFDQWEFTIFSSWPMRGQGERGGAVSACQDTHYYCYYRYCLTRPLTTHSHSIPRQMPTLSPIQFTRRSWTWKCLDNGPITDHQMDKTWRYGQMWTREIWPMVITCHLASDWPGLSLS